jgi:iron complex transport system permease protein
VQIAAAAQRWTRRGIRGTESPVPRVHAAVLLPALAVLLVVAILAGVGIGAVRIAPEQTIAILLHHLGLDTDIAFSQQQDAIVWAIRLPRVILALLVGSSLAVSGAVLQGMFRNPLADPGLIGVSSGAALGAVASVALGFSFLGVATLPVFAFVGGVITSITVYFIARHDGKTEIVTLVLTGIALNTVSGALTGLLTYVASDQQLRAVVFWSLGSLGSATWTTVGASTPFIVVGLLMIPRWGGALDLFVLGEREARHLGVDTERVRLELIMITALMTGAAVAVAGVVGFVGLIVPHLLRLLAGPSHRVLLPACALGGASLVLLADLAARTIASPAELPLGVITALLGGPFLLLLMLRTRRAQGGWG